MVFVFVCFGLGYSLYIDDLVIIRCFLSDIGVIFVFVFLDLNGNGKYDEGEELILEVQIEVV